MEYMESMIQQQYDAFEDSVKELEPLISGVIELLEKTKMDEGSLRDVCHLFDCGYLPPMIKLINEDGK